MWHHRFNGHKLGQTPRVGERQAGLVCCSPLGHKELDTTWQPNNNKCALNSKYTFHLQTFP